MLGLSGALAESRWSLGKASVTAGAGWCSERQTGFMGGQFRVCVLFGCHATICWASVPRAPPPPPGAQSTCVQAKLAGQWGVKYATVAAHAAAQGRQRLAALLLDHEHCSAEQVPLLLELGKQVAVGRRWVCDPFLRVFRDRRGRLCIRNGRLACACPDGKDTAAMALLGQTAGCLAPACLTHRACHARAASKAEPALECATELLGPLLHAC